MTSTERKNWLRDRQGGLGATDIGALCGCAVGGRTAQQVYAEKTGEVDDRDPLPLMELGLALEPYNADLYARRFLGPDDALLSPGLLRSRAADWQIATLDRVASLRRPGETDAYRDVELKYVRFMDRDVWGEDGSDLVPDGYSIQATWQHAILLSAFPSRQIEPPHIAALDSSGEQRVYPIVYSQRLADLLFEIGEDFWGRVRRREPVGPDWVHPLAERAVAEVASVRTDTSIHLGDEVRGLVEGMESAKQAEKHAEAEYKRLKAEVRLAMGDVEIGILSDGRRVKQYPVPEKIIAPKPYLREARVDLRVLAGGRSKARAQGHPVAIEAMDEECILPRRSS